MEIFVWLVEKQFMARQFGSGACYLILIQILVVELWADLLLKSGFQLHRLVCKVEIIGLTDYYCFSNDTSA